jgi:hypothetical protein
VLTSAYNSEHEDYFAIESLTDANHNHIFVSYGFDWKGTWAAGVYLKSIYSQIPYRINAYYICHWVDANGDGVPSANEITTVTSG